MEESEIKTAINKIDKPEGAVNRAKWLATFFEKKVNVRALYKEFLALRQTTKCDIAIPEAQKDKSRYADVPCLDGTRVILQGRSAETDFIHANWMTMPDGFKYISTQGPMDETIEDFWHMVVTEKVGHILMMCNFSENKLVKCAQYIPPENKEFRKFGVYKVRRMSKITEPFEDVKHQMFEITHKSNKDIKLTVNHYQYTEWPDHTAPKSADSATKLYKIFRDPSNTQPVVVHCSAGVGRTATFVGIDYAFQKIGQNATFDILDVIRDTRKMRAKAIQTHHQFVFLIICLTQLIVMEGAPKNEHMDTMLAFYRVRVDKNRKKNTKKEAENKSEGI